ncbi:uncharacterized protein LOC130191665 [Pseudoliparis swirei]|uniref:uncharacterized protein LOC130191665 n=1 Tax=Pseudoliparis swirei TaxID=2059687 RepID=UPI0024BE9DA6|nr:uncharacterized protein LOC130191665 [Pseudoliparis swirei]
MFALRTKKQFTTKYTPYYLMFGREARYPSEIPAEYNVTEDKVCGLVQREAMADGLRNQKVVFEDVLQNIKISQDRVRKRKSQIGQEDHFKVGDRVLQKNIKQEQRKGGKMESTMLGPFTIVELEGKKAVLATQKGKRVTQTNIDSLTHCFQPEERIPAKLKRVLEPSPLAGPSKTQSQGSSVRSSSFVEKSSNTIRIKTISCAVLLLSTDSSHWMLNHRTSPDHGPAGRSSSQTSPTLFLPL